MILSLVGDEPTQVIQAPPTSTKCRGRHHDAFVFPNGVRGHVFVSWLHPFKEQKLVVVGSESMAVFDDTQAWATSFSFIRTK